MLFFYTYKNVLCTFVSIKIKGNQGLYMADKLQWCIKALIRLGAKTGAGSVLTLLWTPQHILMVWFSPTLLHTTVRAPSGTSNSDITTAGFLRPDRYFLCFCNEHTRAPRRILQSNLKFWIPSVSLCSHPPQHVFLMSQYRSEFQIKVMVSRREQPRRIPERWATRETEIKNIPNWWSGSKRQTERYTMTGGCYGLFQALKLSVGHPLWLLDLANITR